ncbi:hypothetical protein FHR55_002401 [Xanthomonas arboricola]
MRCRRCARRPLVVARWWACNGLLRFCDRGAVSLTESSPCMHAASVLPRTRANVDAEIAYWRDLHADGHLGGYAFDHDARVPTLGYTRSIWPIRRRPKRGCIACCRMRTTSPIDTIGAVASGALDRVRCLAAPATCWHEALEMTAVVGARLRAMGVTRSCPAPSGALLQRRCGAARLNGSRSGRYCPRARARSYEAGGVFARG